MAGKTDTESKGAAKAEPKPFYATRDFTDGGTFRRFERGAELKQLTEGELGNYVAAGLASHEPPKSPAETETAVLGTVLG